MQKYLVAFVFTFYTTISYAISSKNQSVGLLPPPFSYMYYLNIFLPWVFLIVVILETKILAYLQKNITFGQVIGIVFISNIVSTVLGILTTSLLFSHRYKDIDLYNTDVRLGIPIAYMLSTLIEFVVLYLSKNIDKPFRSSILINAATYCLIALFFIIDDLFS